MAEDSQATEVKTETSEEVETKEVETQEAATEEVETEEIEIDEDDIYGYIFDEDDNELGFITQDEDGTEHEYYYAEPIPASESEALKLYGASEEVSAEATKPAAAPKKKVPEGELDPEEVAAATKAMNEVYKEGHEVLSELSDMMKDIQKDLRDLKIK